MTDVTPSAPPRQAASLLAESMEGIDLAVLWVDANGTVEHANATFVEWTGCGSPGGRPLTHWIPAWNPDLFLRAQDVDGPVAPLHRLEIGRAGHTALAVEARLRRVECGGRDLLAILMVPITERLEAEACEQLQRDVLEAIALGRPLQVVLDLLCRRVEAMAPEVICSVLLLENGLTVQPIAGPSLPAAYSAALVGASIGPKAGSCGTAAWRREPVEVIDIATDPLWEDYKGLALPLGLAACWSTPILSLQGDVVATFALYYRRPVAASPFHRRMVEACVPLCRVAIQHEADRAEIERLAYFDSLTGLPNRRLFMDRAEHTLQLAPRLDAAGAILLLDVDRFKTANDSLGHGVGDEILKEIARRLQHELRDSDTVARLGGDEFAALIPGCDAKDAMHVAEKLRLALAEPLPVEGMSLSISASVGISVFPDDGYDLDTLLKNADMAMYESKRAGRNATRFFTRSMHHAADERLRMENALRAALSQQRLQLHYQPKIRLDGSGCAGVEALVRWTDPDFGAVAPDRFIPLAEECGLINALDAWVLETACAQMAQWREQGLAVPSMAVNVSPQRFHQDDVPAHVSQVLSRWRLPAECLMLEITERLMLNDDERTGVDLRALHEMGVRLSVDDFGTGYSSLGYLKRLPVNELKLDRGFVRDLESDAGDRALASAVLGIGRALGLQVVAEGVETAGQREILAQAGYAIAQGWAFTPALPWPALQDWIDAGHARLAVPPATGKATLT